MAQRTFTDAPATRERVPLLLGLTGPSGGGKTMSALRLATGIQRVSGGEIFMIDTESRRGLHYADRFNFRHVPFGAPFSPLDYLAAIEHCTRKGAGVVIVDSMSHEHEGPGGVLEMHEAEVKRMAGDDYKKAERVKMLAWSKPKQERRRMINTILQLPVTSIFCFRAKEKLKIVPGKEPQPLGWMPIAGEEFIYEMTVNMLLPPGVDGVPEWSPTEQGEKQMLKLPEQFRQLFAQRQALNEDIGEALAKWAEGTVKPHLAELAGEIARAADEDALLAIGPKIKAAEDARKVTASEVQTLRSAFKARRATLAAATDPAEPDALDDGREATL